MLPRLLRDVIDLCYPGVCANCQSSCEAEAFLCPPCVAQLVSLEQAPACPYCAMPVAEEEAPCPFCHGAGVRHYERVFRLGVFDEPLRNLIHQMKYQRQWSVGERLAERLWRQPRVEALLAGVQVITPVPLHFVRRFTRGYNQASVLARYLAQRSHKSLARPLARVRHTRTQTHLHSRRQRMDNVRRAFRLTDPESIRGRHVLVIDDVMTTGATLQAVARALRPARPASLSALVLAVADPRGRDFEAV